MFQAKTPFQQALLGMLVVGLSLLLGGACLLGYTYLPLWLATWRYQHLSTQPIAKVALPNPSLAGSAAQKAITAGGKANPGVAVVEPVNTTFAIVIPKIGANAPVIDQVNPLDPNEYQFKLAQGVAHAKGTPLPGATGTSFLFAHSSGDITSARRYNAVFYLLDKLAVGDNIFIARDQVLYRFQVEKTEIVNPEQTKYLQPGDLTQPDQKLILMTCTPAGTDKQRLLVHARLVPTTQ